MITSCLIKINWFFFLSIELVMLSLTMVPWVFSYLPTFFALLDVVHKKGELFVCLFIYVSIGLFILPNELVVVIWLDYG